jgi:hypothetical protein
MKIMDFYLFQMNQNFRSMQFVPRKINSSLGNNKDPELDGYIFCTMINGTTDISNDNDAYTREIWIFDAAQLSRGPLCKLSHPDMIYAFTIHSAWMEDCESIPSTYNVPVKEDYDEVLSTFKNGDHKQIMEELLKNWVYPKFNA